jgi:hypothetical protein
LLLAFTALASTTIALGTELSFACARRKGLLLRSGPLGLAVRRVQRGLDRCIPLLSGVAVAASLGLALSAGVMTRGGNMGLAAALALGAHLWLYANVAQSFHDEAGCLKLAQVPPKELAALQARWEVAMHTRASLLVAAFVCVVASVILG